MQYAQKYENSLHFSPTFQSYAATTARRLIQRYDLYGKDIVEIGCGKGDFLKLLCELGENSGLGFDPSYAPVPAADGASERITFIPDFYSEGYSDHGADLICCRHMLEHIPNPIDFLGMIRRAIGARLDTVVFFEVPNVLFILRDLSIWDIIYEHCSYFSAHSLRRAFTDSGFKVCDVAEVFEGQFLCIEAVPDEETAGAANNGWDNCQKIGQYAAEFAEKYRSTMEAWRGELQRLTEAGRRLVLWGAGSKGVTFLNTLKSQDQIEYVVDINPRKHGRYIAGTGQEILPPKFLRTYRPDAIIAMNAIYESEIRQLTKKLGLVDLELLSVSGRQDGRGRKTQEAGIQ
jgi:SAM-dependent methyltransferase